MCYVLERSKSGARRVVGMPAPAGMQVSVPALDPAYAGMTFPLYSQAQVRAFNMHNTL